MPMQDALQDDLSDFARNGMLDAYELTDEELARLLEVWRWSVWRRMHQPTAPDYDILEQSQRLQRRLAREHNLEVEYNTGLLLKQEIEPLLYIRILLSAPRALWYFVHPRRIFTFWRCIWRVMRYNQIDPMQDGKQDALGYPVWRLDAQHPTAPDLLKRPYWRQLSPHTFAERKRFDVWW